MLSIHCNVLYSTLLHCVVLHCIHCPALLGRFLTGNGSTVGRLSLNCTVLQNTEQNCITLDNSKDSAGKVGRPIFLGRFFGEAGGKKGGGGEEEEMEWKRRIGGGGEREGMVSSPTGQAV